MTERLSIKDFRNTLLITNYSLVNEDDVLLKAYANQDYSYVYIRKDDIITDMIKWLLTNVNEKDWDSIPGVIFFSHETDATAFRLVWA